MQKIVSPKKSGIQAILTFRISAVIIVIDNLLPIFGVFFFNWKVFPILMFYFIESVIVVTFEYYRKLKQRPPQKGAPFELPPVAAYFLLIVILVLGLYLPLVALVVIAAGRVPNAIELITNIYFILSVIILVTGILIPGIRQVILEKKLPNNRATEKQRDRDVIFIFKPYLVMAITFTIVATNFYTASLILIAIGKACLELYLYLKRQRKTA